MKFSLITNFLSLLIIFHTRSCFAEGFACGTMIKIRNGYTKIENIRIGDCIVCYDSKNNCVEGHVAHIAKKSVDQYVQITIAGECLCVAYDQRLYDENSDLWVMAGSLKDGNILAGHMIKVELVNELIDVYLISVAKYHNFLVTSANICAHNFFPLVFAISAAFGSGVIELVSISFGIAGIGAFFGYKWYKKNEQQHTIVMQPQYCGGGMMPEDPEEEKKKKRDEAIEEHRPLTNKEARNQAKQLGYKEEKPPFDTHGELAFRKDNIYISPDNTGHNGGVWKMFTRNGQRIGTWNKNLTNKIKG